MNELLEQFLIESRELIAQATNDLLALEYNPTDTDRLDSAFRAVHTLKGAAGIMDFDAMARITHAAEDALSAVRAGMREMTAALVTDCLACLDQISTWLDRMQVSEVLPEGADSEAASIISKLISNLDDPIAESPSGEFSTEPSWCADISVDAIKLLHEQIDILALPHDIGSAGRSAAALAVTANILQQFYEDPNIVTPAIGLPRVLQEGTSKAQNDVSPARSERMDTTHLDSVVRLAGELVIVKNALGHSLDLAQHSGLPKQQSQNLALLYGQLERVTRELLHTAVSARVLPLRSVFQRFPRLVREMATGINKKIRLVLQGEATEADRLIVESLFEPLLHVLRNAVDHGVEPAEERETLGKPSLSAIHLSAARVGDEVIIEIADDGRGIDPAAIRVAAIARGVASAPVIEAMPDDAILELIFAPGFSTAAAVSNISGRGVGMDAVQAAIDRLGGRVEVASALGSGTTIRFLLPYTVMLTKVLIVQADGQIFGIPFESVVETLRINRRTIVNLGAAETILWRDETLPLISLAEVLSLEESEPDEELLVVVVEHRGESVALQVVQFGGQIEVMLKPLDGLLAGMQNVAGVALLGDGRVLIVLELQELLS